MVRRGPPDRTNDSSSYWIILMTVEGAGTGVSLQKGGIRKSSGRPKGGYITQMLAKPCKTGQTMRALDWVRFDIFSLSHLPNDIIPYVFLLVDIHRSIGSLRLSYSTGCFSSIGHPPGFVLQMI